MITFFTTFKDFKGKNRVNQINAIQSWLFLDKAVEVIVFSESDGVEEVLSDSRVTHIKDSPRYQDRVPLIGPMFNQADQLSKNDICCFINSDIIITKDFYDTLVSVHQKNRNNYLLIGQRFDVDVPDAIEYHSNWEQEFSIKYESNFTLHTPTGSDYFAFPKGQYAEIDFPTLLVGRPGWDLWMIYNAINRKMKAIDLSPAVKVIHQNHDYKHKSQNKAVREDEDNINYKSLPEQYWYFTLLACNYQLDKSKQLQKNYARGNQEHLLRMNIEMKRKKSLNKLILMFYSEKSALTSNLSKKLTSFLVNKVLIPLKIYS